MSSFSLSQAILFHTPGRPGRFWASGALNLGWDSDGPDDGSDPFPDGQTVTHVEMAVNVQGADPTDPPGLDTHRTGWAEAYSGSLGSIYSTGSTVSLPVADAGSVTLSVSYDPDPATDGIAIATDLFNGNLKLRLEGNPGSDGSLNAVVLDYMTLSVTYSPIGDVPPPVVGIYPLRQYPRDDGLVSGARRGGRRSASRQASIRRGPAGTYI